MDAKHMSRPRGRVLTALLDAKAIIESFAERNPQWSDLLGRTQDPLGAHQWLSNFGDVADGYGEEIANAQEAAAYSARAGVHEVAAGFDDLPFDGCPEEWVEKPFCRIAWFYDGGDSSVGQPARYGWSLADDQSGTVIADLAGPAK